MRNFLIIAVFVLLSAALAGLIGLRSGSSGQFIMENICIERTRGPIMKRVYGDVKGLCSCIGNIDLNGTIEERKEYGLSCLDKFSKIAMVKHCGNMGPFVQETQKKTLDCECFYKEYTSLMSLPVLNLSGEPAPMQEQALPMVDDILNRCSK